MPKMKTKKSAAKRFKVSASGRVKFKRSKMRHNLELKSHATKKKLGKSGMLSAADAKTVRKMMPYG
jgi:large subunit ribosomal protein L35